MRNQTVVLRDMALLHPDKVAIRTGAEALPYEQLWFAVCVLANQLVRSGVEPGDRVAVLSANGSESAIGYLAATAVGAVAALLPSDRTLQVLLDLTALVRPAAVVLGRTPTGARWSSELAAALALHAGVAPLPIDTAPARRPAAEGFVVQETALPRPHLILFTGGTTAAAKAVLHQEDRYALVTALSVQGLEITRDDVLVNPYPAHHYGGIQALNQALLVGAELVQLPIPGEQEILTAIEQHRGTFIVAVPTLWRRLLQHPEFARRDLSSLRMANIASDFVPVDLMRAIRARTGAASVQGYGSTEAGLVTLTPLAAGLDKDGSCGLPDKVSAVCIVDETGRPLPAGQAGHLRVRSQHMMAGYFGDPKATAEAFDDGWFITGDLGYLDVDGHLVITGRAKNVISCGADKLVPEEIEAALQTHPAVDAAIVVGAPDAELGEVPAALVQLRPGAAITVAALGAHSGQALGWTHRIRHAVFVDALPLTPAGKLDRLRAGQLLRQHGDGDASTVLQQAAPARASDLPALASDAAADVGRDEAAVDAAAETVVTVPVAEQVAALFARVLKRPAVAMDADILDLGADSLTVLRLMLAVEDRLGVELDPEQFMRERTAAGVARLVGVARALTEAENLAKGDPAWKSIP